MRIKPGIIVLTAVLLILAALCAWQRNTITALYLFATESKADIEKDLEKEELKLDEILKEYSSYMPRKFTSEEEKKIASGELSIEAAVDMLLEETEQERHDKEEEENKGTIPSSDGKAQQHSASVSNKTEGDEESTIIRKYTAKLYSIKAYYIGQLSGIESRASAEFSAMSAKEKKNLSKAAFVAKYAGYASSLLSQCDGEVSSILGEMKAELKAVDGDLSIITAIKQAYEGEKSARKAYYMSLVS